MCTAAGGVGGSGGMGSKNIPPPKLQAWIDARRRYHLSHAQIQMARELGMNPRRFGGLANHGQEPWKSPLPVFIQDLYFKRFGRESPQEVVRIEEIARQQAKQEAARNAARKVSKAQAEQGNEAQADE
jgi:hypothetical protein